MSNILDRKAFKYHHSSTHERVEPFEARLRAARDRTPVARRTKLVLRYAIPQRVAELCANVDQTALESERVRQIAEARNQTAIESEMVRQIAAARSMDSIREKFDLESA